MASTGAVGFGGRTFRAEGDRLIVNPLERRKPDGLTGITLGFPFCDLHEALSGEEGVAAELAEYLSCPKRAAAPDLYEALEWAIRQLDSTMIETTAAWARYDACNAALSKALGK